MRKRFLPLLPLVLFLIVGFVHAEERLLYGTNFQDWTAVSSSSSVTLVSKTTSFTNETLNFKLYETQVNPTSSGVDGTKFSNWTGIATLGNLLAAKTATTYVELSPLKSITKVTFTHGATGSSRGYRLWKKNATDADWVAVTSATDYANPSSGQTVTVTLNETDCALKFTNLNSSQNAYLFDLYIYGNYTTSLPQQTLTTKVNIAEAGSVSRNPQSVTYDQGSLVELTANRNFGYVFSHWTNANGDVVSSNNPYTVTLYADIELTAVFTPINTYSLTVNVDGGANPYMVTASPAGTTVNGKLMYEEGVNVTLSAKSNPLLTFNNWSSGETNTDLVLTMSQDRTVSAVYSAIDYIVGWDFYKSGANGRPADFYSTADNQTAALTIRKADGSTSSWLDKSIVAANGYEGAGAAVNWKPISEKWYYQISFNATDFSSIKVTASMLYNYNAYSVQHCEYSLDGTTFTALGDYTMSAAKTWYPATFDLPLAADHAPIVYVRWIPDYTSTVVGTTSDNDGTALSAIYVTAKTDVFNDGVAPVLVGSVPANASSGASATGKVVLTFDEKVKITNGTTATLGDKTLTPLVSGKTITFAYTGLDYNTQYTFSLAGGVVADLADNTLSLPISVQFTTMARPTVTKKKFDFVVGVDGDFKAALAAATAASSSGNRFYIFFPNGQYNIGANTGDANQMTTIAIPNVSYVGESADGVVVYNQSTQESINSTATVYFTGVSSNIYMQDISLMNKMDYRAATLVGRGVALWDQGNKNIYKNVKLMSNQDTYFTGNSIRSYHENCEIHGTVDFICGGGDIFFNECTLYLESRANGNVVTAPATSTNWGYVFNGCTIDGAANQNGIYSLGRPWQNAPRSVYINTTMKLIPSAAGWSDMGVVPALFAEYNSMTASGVAVDLSSRKKSFTVNSESMPISYNPVLTSTEALNYTVDNVVGGTDSWQPKLYTEQVVAPVLASDGTTLTWDNSDYVLCWAVCKNGAFAEFVTTNSYTIPQGTANGTVFTVRAANEMGGLSAASNTVTYVGTTGVKGSLVDSEVVDVQYFNLNGVRLGKFDRVTGIVMVRTVYKNGQVAVTKMIKRD